MVGPEGRQRVQSHAFGHAVVAGVVVDGRRWRRNGRQSCYGDHRGAWHHGVQDERQTVGHVAVGRAGQRRRVTCGQISCLQTLKLKADASKKAADRSRPRPARWLPWPAAPGPPRSAPAWPPRAGACRQGEALRQKSRLVHRRGVAPLRLQRSVGAVDEVPVADLLQNQQGTRLVALGADQVIGRTRHEQSQVAGGIVTLLQAKWSAVSLCASCSVRSTLALLTSTSATHLHLLYPCSYGCWSGQY